MIVRIWRARATVSNEIAYAEHFNRSVIPELRGVRGFLGASLLRKGRSGEVELLVITKWASMDAVRKFAGSDIAKAVVAPEAAALLTDFDRIVEHYEVVTEIQNPD